jgi:HD-GYP domain-containing protein (c-di-GMP phosphodiesterase class II)
MLINRNEFIFSISFALDFLEMGMRDNITNHNKRVCLIANRVAQALNLDDQDQFDLFAYSMLHDNGMTHDVYNATSENGEDVLESSLSHCIIGEKNLLPFPFLRKRRNIIKYHHENYDGSGYFGITGDGIPLFSQIIAAADKAEMSYRVYSDKEDVIRSIVKNRGSKYSPEICDAFAEVSRHRSFWLSLDDMFIHNELKNCISERITDVELSDLLPFSEILSGIIDEKSPFTGQHSRGISRIAGIMAKQYDFTEGDRIKLIVAANLHDVGKIVIPNSIIDKNGKLTPEEFDIMRGHTFYTRKALEPVKGLEDIVEWASNHHEKLDGTGYPYGIPGNKLPFESQLIACVDIYQALTEKRPYRESLSFSKVADIMTQMAKDRLINRGIVSDMLAYFSDEAA